MNAAVALAAARNPGMGLSTRGTWKALLAHHAEVGGRHLRALFAADPQRGTRFTLEAAGLYLDYSKNRIDAETLRLLVALALDCDLPGRTAAMFRGDRINTSEHRAALHTALRAPADERIVLDGVDVVAQVHATLDRMAERAATIRSGQWLGHTGKPIRNVVNIGIGGSDLGPVMAYEALHHYSASNLQMRFVSNVDGTDLVEAIRDLAPEETLFIVCSKSFATLETLTNAQAARAWSLRKLGDERSVARHFLAVSANVEAAAKFGIPHANLFPMCDWVGGRYSIDSAIGLSTMIAIGDVQFREMLRGMRSMDEHFLSAPLPGNLPALMGLLSVWNNNVLGATSLAVLPYDQYLKRFPAYLQQLTMESNGKHVTLEGLPVTEATSPVVWGEQGTNGQHSFYQMLHQGTRLVACDFIGFCQSLNPKAASMTC